jgi:hypothetical protein
LNGAVFETLGIHLHGKKTIHIVHNAKKKMKKMNQLALMHDHTGLLVPVSSRLAVAKVHLSDVISSTNSTSPENTFLN